MKQYNQKKQLKNSIIILSGVLLACVFLTWLFFTAGSIPLSVRIWTPLVKKELQANDLEEYTPIVMAIIAQESGGKKLDVMQSSESIELPPNTIKDPRESIKTGIAYFKQSIERMEETDVDLDTAIQSYNYGLGYIDYIKENGGKHSADLSEEFAKEWAKKMDWPSYGDAKYAYKIKHYRKKIS